MRYVKEATSLAVSYTHLDVYKRQLEFLSFVTSSFYIFLVLLWRVGRTHYMIFFSSFISSIFGHGHTCPGVFYPIQLLVLKSSKNVKFPCLYNFLPSKESHSSSLLVSSFYLCLLISFRPCFFRQSLLLISCYDRLQFRHY